MNIPEILVANGTGAVLVSFLLLLRVRGESKNSVGTELFCRILVVTLLAQATETISFLLDGVPGAASRFWLYLTNTVCTGATVSVGYAWCLYVDFRVYRSIGRLRRRHLLLGTLLQGAFYGMAFGWLSVAIAFVLVDSQTRSLRGYTDELSGLFGRKYMNYCLDRIHATQEKDVYGIMMDVNCFKEINDTYGHAEGDRAIQEIGHILSGALAANSVAIRMSGDEFMVLIRHGSEELLDKTCAAIERRVQHYNETAPAGSFQLSFSTGVAKYEGGSVEKFLVELDQRMYAEKRAFHAARDSHAAPEQGNAPSI
ncbi:MAG: GGDEF domain-containing protein [Faecalibacterium sp.]